MAGGDDQFSTGGLDLPHLHSAINQALFLIREGPGAAARAAAQVVQRVVAHLKIETGVDALLGDPAGLFSDGGVILIDHKGLEDIVTRIVNRISFVILMGIQFDLAGFDVLLQQSMTLSTLNSSKTSGNNK